MVGKALVMIVPSIAEARPATPSEAMIAQKRHVFGTFVA